MHVVKLDIEGGELHALHGALAMLRKSQPEVIMEINNQLIAAANITRPELFAVMKASGYVGVQPLSVNELDWFFTPSEQRLNRMRARVEAAYATSFCGQRRCSEVLVAIGEEADRDWRSA